MLLSDSALQAALMIVTTRPNKKILPRNSGVTPAAWVLGHLIGEIGIPGSGGPAKGDPISGFQHLSDPFAMPPSVELWPYDLVPNQS